MGFLKATNLQRGEGARYVLFTNGKTKEEQPHEGWKQVARRDLAVIEREVLCAEPEPDSRQDFCDAGSGIANPKEKFAKSVDEGGVVDRGPWCQTNLHRTPV